MITIEMTAEEAKAIAGALQSWVYALGDDYPDDAEIVDEVVELLWSKLGGAK